ncbi:MAG: c-type cytochrome [Bacteroidota bacterium]
MRLSELLSRLLITSGVAITIGVPLFVWSRTPLIHASVAEAGGWSPDTLKAQAGQPVHLRLTSDDVVHGFAVGQMDMQAVDVLPGKVSEVTLTFDRPGTYTFYCTRWCGLNHWRMRGTIEVEGSGPAPDPVEAPIYVRLGIDIDAAHEAPVIPADRPSAARGQALLTGLGLALSEEDYQSHSPYEVFRSLSTRHLSDAQRWDAVAALWRSNTTTEGLENGRRLFAQNCAACHGEGGAGDGIFADDLAAAGKASMQTMDGAPEMNRQRPADFTDPKRMLGASPALLQGKILRGGMGTGMPMWGSIFTTQQIRDLVAYIFSFQFDDRN